MPARLSAFVIWALVAASAVFWGLRLLVRAPAAPAYTVPVGDAGALRGDLTRLLGTAPVAPSDALPTPEAASRFRLFGIMAPRDAKGAARRARSGGVALIAVDGKLPKAYTVGSRLDADLLLQSVSLRSVSIAPASGAPAITLELPPPAAAATGTLSVGGSSRGTDAPVLAAPPAFVAPQTVPQPVPPIVPPLPQPNARIPATVPGAILPRPEPNALTQ